MSLTRNPGRIAGFLYLILVVFAPFRLIYIPSKLFVHGNATASNIAAHEFLFRLGILSDLLCGTVLIFLALSLYRLLKGVDQNLVVLMVILGGMRPYSRSLSGTPWPCCSCDCTIRKSSPPRSFGVFGFFPWRSLSTGRVSCPVSWVSG
jgi:hypothetical protein